MIDRSGEIKRILITGIMGSSGKFLCDHLRAHRPQVEIHGTARRKGRKDGPTGVALHECDLLDTASIVRALRASRPDAIFHLAANPDKGFEIPSAILMNNAVGSVNLFEAVRLERGFHPPEKPDFDPLLVSVSSSEVYGDVRPEDVPITEECPLRPVSPYGIAKLAQDHFGRVYHKAHGLRIVTTRAFTYLNPHRQDLFATSFARQIAKIEVGKRDVLMHGNLDSVRTLMSAESVAEAYWLAATRCRFGEVYNIGGTATMTVGEVLLRLSGMSHKAPIRTVQGPDLLRPADVTHQVPCSDKFRKETGWQEKLDVDAALRGLLEHWRREVRK